MDESDTEEPQWGDESIPSITVKDQRPFKKYLGVVMMLQTANWMISYLLKAQLIKLIETDVLYRDKDFRK